MGASASAASRPGVDFARGDKSFRHGNVEEDRSAERPRTRIRSGEFSSDSNASSSENEQERERRDEHHSRPARSRSRATRSWDRSLSEGGKNVGSADGGRTSSSSTDVAVRASWMARRRDSSGGYLRSRARRTEVVEGISSSSSEEGQPMPRGARMVATETVRRGRRKQKPVIDISSDSSSDECDKDVVCSSDPTNRSLCGPLKSPVTQWNAARTPYSIQLTGSRDGDGTRNVLFASNARPNHLVRFSSSSSDEDDIDGHGDEEEVYDWLEFDTDSSLKNAKQHQKSMLHDCDETDENESSDEVYDWLEFDTGQNVAKIQRQTLVSGNRLRQHNTSLSPSLQNRRPNPPSNQPFERTMLSPTQQAICPHTPDGNITEAMASKTIFTPPTPDSPLVGSESSMLCRKPSNRIIKDTKRVTKKKAALPPSKPHAIKGDWLTNRHVVNNYILLNQLGKGSYGEVRLCKERTSNELFAIKVMDKKVLQKKVIGKSSTSFDDVKREVAIMKKLKHENVVRLYEVMDDPRHNKLYLVLEYMKRGDLIQIASDPSTKFTNPLTDEQVWDICRQVFLGLKYLHDQDIAHGDIKPHNILVSGDGMVKIADFGIAKMISRSSELQLDTAGTPAFMAPEICAGLAYDAKMADIYAVGATMFCVRCGQPPFRSNPCASPSNQLLDLYERIQKDPVIFPIPVADGLKRLIEKLMVKDPGLRSSLMMVLHDPWLQVRPV